MRAVADLRETEERVVQWAHPWLVVARVAGWAAFPFAIMGWFMVYLFRTDPRTLTGHLSTGQHVAAWSFAIAGTAFIPLLVLRRRLLDGAIARERALLATYSIEGWFEALGQHWTDMKYRRRRYGVVEIYVGTVGVPPISELQAKTTAVVNDTVVTERAGGLVFTHPEFSAPEVAHAWARKLVARILPLIHADHPIRRVVLKYQRLT
jgi:hypothetical protein